MGMSKKVGWLYLGILIFPILVTLAIREKSKNNVPPKQQADEKGWVTRVYDVRDILFIPRNSMPHKMGWFGGPSEQEIYAEVISPGKAMKQLKKLITETVAPKSWPSDKSCLSTVHKDNLVITQTPEVHKQVENLLETLRKARELRVQVDNKLIRVDPAMDEKLMDDFKLKSFEVKDADGCTFLTADQLENFIKTAQESKKTKTLKLPRITLFNGQRTYAMIATDRVLQLPLVKGSGEGCIYITYCSGTFFDIDPTVSHDRKSVTIAVNTGVYNITKKSKSWFPTATTVSTTVTIPDNGAIIFRKPVETRQAVGVTVKPGGQLVVVEKKINEKPTEYLYFIVQPKIIVVKPVETKSTKPKEIARLKF